MRSDSLLLAPDNKPRIWIIDRLYGSVSIPNAAFAGISEQQTNHVRPPGLVPATYTKFSIRAT
jgi:hypothetical protein